MRKVTPEFIEFLKEHNPDSWEEQIKKYETDEGLQKLSDFFCEALDLESPYVKEEPKEDEEKTPVYDPIDHPRHYVEQAATIEPIEILRFAPFDLGNALKYMIRAGHKDDALQDLKKAEWYLECTQKTQVQSFYKYRKFFHRYGFILQKFDGIPSDLMVYSDPIKELLDFVRTRIANYAPESETEDEA